MPLALNNSIDIELLIDDRRSIIFEEITKRDPATLSSSERGFDSNPLLYNVIMSFWNKSESKRVFKVMHLGFEYSYYAFMLHDYIVCPAFLAESLEITNYTCLNVIYGSNYSYIFIKMKDNDTKLNITGDQFNFYGNHLFELSMREGRILNLNSENKNTRCFIRYESCWDELG
jgi:hypothetical protein